MRSVRRLGRPFLTSSRSDRLRRVYGPRMELRGQENVSELFMVRESQLAAMHLWRVSVLLGSDRLSRTYQGWARQEFFVRLGLALRRRDGKIGLRELLPVSRLRSTAGCPLHPATRSPKGGR